MAIKSSDQLTIIDVTDGYSANLTLDSYTFPGSTTAALAGNVATQVSVMRGSTQVAANVVLSEITKPSGVTVTSDNNSTAPTLTIAVNTSVTQPGKVSIPIHADDVVIVKEFSFAIAKQGAKGTDGTNGTNGAPGRDGADGADGQDGKDAIMLVITSSNGTIFKNTAIATTLTAHVYKGGMEVTGSALNALGTIKWYKDGGTSAVGTGATLVIDAGDVAAKAVYEAKLEG